MSFNGRGLGSVNSIGQCACLEVRCCNTKTLYIAGTSVNTIVRSVAYWASCTYANSVSDLECRVQLFCGFGDIRQIILQHFHRTHTTIYGLYSTLTSSQTLQSLIFYFSPRPRSVPFNFIMQSFSNSFSNERHQPSH
jgi:hypothetical protein